MSMLAYTYLTTWDKVYLAASTVVARDHFGHFSSLAEDFELSRPTPLQAARANRGKTFRAVRAQLGFGLVFFDQSRPCAV